MRSSALNERVRDAEDALLELSTAYEVQVTFGGVQLCPQALSGSQQQQHHAHPLLHEAQLDTYRADQVELKSRIRKLTTNTAYADVFRKVLHAKGVTSRQHLTLALLLLIAVRV